MAGNIYFFDQINIGDLPSPPPPPRRQKIVSVKCVVYRPQTFRYDC